VKMRECCLAGEGRLCLAEGERNGVGQL
jgi:hypothetical protein